MSQTDQGADAQAHVWSIARTSRAAAPRGRATVSVADAAADRGGATVSVADAAENWFDAVRVTVRQLSPIEFALAFAIGGSVLAVAVPEFLHGLHASRLVEPIDGLKRVAVNAVALASREVADPAFPASVALTPAEVPRGVRVSDPDGTWEHPSWRALTFGFDYPHAFSFAFESSQGAASARFRATAHGDLDGDGVQSTFEVEGERDAAGARVIPGMYVESEVE